MAHKIFGPSHKSLERHSESGYMSGMATFLDARKAMKLDQKAMASELRVSQASLSRIERGKQAPSAATLLRLMDLAKRRRVKLDLAELAA